MDTTPLEQLVEIFPEWRAKTRQRSNTGLIATDVAGYVTQWKS